MIYQSTAAGGLLDRIDVVHVQAIAELVDTGSDLLPVNREMRREPLRAYLVKLDAFLAPERKNA